MTAHHLFKPEKAKALRCLIAIALLYMLIVGAARACGSTHPASRALGRSSIDVAEGRGAR